MVEHFNGLHDRIGASGCAQGHITAGNPLGHGDDIGLNIKVFGRKHLAGASKATDHLVDDQQYPELITNLPNNGPLFLRRSERAKTLLNGLSDKG